MISMMFEATDVIRIMMQCNELHHFRHFSLAAYGEAI